MDLYTIFHTALVFWIVLDSVGSVPIFVSLLKHFEPKVQRKIVMREMLIALAVMVLFFFFGEAFFHIMGISKSSLQIAGGIILLLISIQMIFSTPQEDKIQSVHKEPIIVPLAVPSIAGPGMLTMISLYGGGLDANRPAVLLSLGIAWLLSIPPLLLATYLKKILGTNGLVAIEQLFGYVIILIAVHVISNGFFSIFHLNGA